MTLATIAAGDALAASLTGVAGLPPLVRNDVSLDGFAPTLTPKVKWKLSLTNDDIGNPESMFGGSQYELQVGQTLIFAVEGETSDGALTVFNAATEVLAEVLYPDGVALQVDGGFDSLNLAENIERRLIPSEGGRPPIMLLRLSITLLITAPTPLG